MKKVTREKHLDYTVRKTETRVIYVLYLIFLSMHSAEILHK